MRYRNELTLDGHKILLQTDLSPISPKTTWDTQRHCHPTFEIHLILSGKCHVEGQAQTYSLEKEQALLVPPGIYHRFLSHCLNFSRFTLTLSPNPVLRHRLSALFPNCTPFSITEKTADLCNHLLQENAAANPYKEERLQALLALLTIDLLRLLQVPDSKTGKHLPVTDLERFSLIDEFFEKHFADDSGEEDLAAQLHLSKRQLARVLEKHYGMTFRQKRLGARMDRTAWLLRNTEYTVSHIAGQVGYSSESTFFQVFRRHFGVTPGRYRLQNK